jgi:hypothetical protein
LQVRLKAFIDIHILFDTSYLKPIRLKRFTHPRGLVALQFNHPPAHSSTAATSVAQSLRKRLDRGVRVLRPEPFDRKHGFPTPMCGKTAKHHAAGPRRLARLRACLVRACVFRALSANTSRRTEVRQPR